MSHLLVNSKLKPDTSPRTTHESHLVSPDTRTLPNSFGGEHPPVRALKRTVSIVGFTKLKSHTLEFSGIITPNIFRGVHWVNWYPNFITLVQLHNPPISQWKRYIFHSNPLRARDWRPKPQGFPNDHV